MKSLVAALTLLLSLTLAGCGGGSGPVDPPSSISSTPTPTSTAPAAPTPPVGTYDRTKAGVIKFAKYYWTVVDYSLTTGDTNPLKALEHKCAACEAGRKWIQAVYRRGGRVTGGRHVPSRFHALAFAPDGSGLSLRMMTTAQRVSGAGSMDGVWPVTHHSFTMRIDAVNASWRVTEWRILQ
ncbi:DUF6318 family protein [Nocardioides montaniterrae]